MIGEIIQRDAAIQMGKARLNAFSIACIILIQQLTFENPPCMTEERWNCGVRFLKCFFFEWAMIGTCMLFYYSRLVPQSPYKSNDFVNCIKMDASLDNAHIMNTK